MNLSFTDREKQILERLKKKPGSTSIQDLARAFSVSTMTIHRDLNRLAQSGFVRKQHGSATVVDDQPDAVQSPCAMCGKTTIGKKVFIVHQTAGEQKSACCAHCGLMLQAQTRDAWQSMTTDFLHSHMISANQAIYLIGSDLNVCCVPSILTFGSRQEAERFQTGCGGRITDLEGAIVFLLGSEHTA